VFGGVREREKDIYLLFFKKRKIFIYMDIIFIYTDKCVVKKGKIVLFFWYVEGQKAQKKLQQKKKKI
jgi:hypothetical protein